MNDLTVTSLQYIFVNVQCYMELSHNLLYKLTGEQLLFFMYKQGLSLILIIFPVVEEMEVVQHYYFPCIENYTTK